MFLTYLLMKYNGYIKTMIKKDELFGVKLRKARLEASYSQKELAALIGVTFQTISKWELNKSLPDIFSLKKLSEILQKDIYYFID